MEEEKKRRQPSQIGIWIYVRSRDMYLSRAVIIMTKAQELDRFLFWPKNKGNIGTIRLYVCICNVHISIYVCTCVLVISRPKNVKSHLRMYILLIWKPVTLLVLGRTYIHSLPDMLTLVSCTKSESSYISYVRIWYVCIINNIHLSMKDFWCACFCLLGCRC